MACTTCIAGDYSAITSGNWNDTSTWMPGAIPDVSDTVYIGCNYPEGSASTATVTLTQDQSANNVTLAYSNGSNGILNLGNSKLTISNYLYIGSSTGATGSILRGSGSFSCSGLYVDHGNSLDFGALDSVNNLTLSNTSTATTTAVGNIKSGIDVQYSTLKLGDNLSLTGNLNIRGSGATLDMGYHTITANQIFLGWDWDALTTLLNRGKLTT
ncbi:MAG: hypothetical protein ABSA26_16775, partial [Thermoguttaceae bacterium]